MRVKKPNGYWDSLDNCRTEAKRYSTRSGWQKEHPVSYRAASKNGWLDDCSAHMTVLKKPHGYWTLEKCKEEAI